MDTLSSRFKMATICNVKEYVNCTNLLQCKVVFKFINSNIHPEKLNSVRRKLIGYVIPGEKTSGNLTAMVDDVVIKQVETANSPEFFPRLTCNHHLDRIQLYQHYSHTFINELITWSVVMHRGQGRLPEFMP